MLLCSVIDHVTLTFDLNLVGIVARGVSITLPPVLVFHIGRFVLYLSANTYLSDALRDLATFTFDLGGHSA